MDSWSSDDDEDDFPTMLYGKSRWYSYIGSKYSHIDDVEENSSLLLLMILMMMTIVMMVMFMNIPLLERSTPKQLDKYNNAHKSLLS